MRRRVVSNISPLQNCPALNIHQQVNCQQVFLVVLEAPEVLVDPADQEDPAALLIPVMVILIHITSQLVIQEVQEAQVVPVVPAALVDLEVPVDIPTVMKECQHLICQLAYLVVPVVQAVPEDPAAQEVQAVQEDPEDVPHMPQLVNLAVLVVQEVPVDLEALVDQAALEVQVSVGTFIAFSG
jgi:hypothetical protein